MTQDEMKLAAASYALDRFITSNIFLGLGSGSTAEIFLAELAARVNRGELENITCVATSERVASLAKGYGLQVQELNDVRGLDVTVDGADEVEPSTFNVTKGRGGALLWEKLVANASKLEIIIADETKLVDRLGTKMPIPVEVIPFGWSHVAQSLLDMGSEPVLRQRENAPYITDSGNYILDCQFSNIENASELADKIKNLVGVVEHGLFINIVGRVVIAGTNGAYELPLPN
ncbi:ribose-5-phosphate isomerase RpiA [Candidatus Chlorohelix sp.]|uniref:ribose-5-phosphate isomerase RpiA n=1 Tax=Candidatus Chlorohelix sp. TaxID=3139201 RepID=UPI00302B77FD